MKLFNRELTIDETIGFAKVMKQQQTSDNYHIVDCANDLADEVTRLKAEILELSQAKWIPVSEQEKPQKDGIYLCTVIRGWSGKEIVDTAEYCYDEWKINNGYDLIAWQPLPKLYESEVKTDK